MQTPLLIIYFMGGLLYCLISTELAIDLQVPTYCKIVPPLLPPPAQYALTTAGGEISPENIGAQLKIYFLETQSENRFWSEVLMCRLLGGGGAELGTLVCCSPYSVKIKLMRYHTGTILLMN